MGEGIEFRATPPSRLAPGGEGGGGGGCQERGAMPVWGEVFEQELEGDSRQHRQALREVQAVAEYVRALGARER